MQINDMSHDHPQKCNIIGNIGRTMNLEPSVEPKQELEPRGETQIYISNRKVSTVSNVRILP